MTRALLIPWLFAALLAQPAQLRVGEIEFYGYAGLDTDAIRKSLPLREGATVAEDEMPKVIERLKRAARTSQVNAVCCDGKGMLMVYIGLPGGSARTPSYNAAPKGAARFPRYVDDLYQRFLDALSKAVRNGASGEEHSKGYALSADPTVRACQVSMRRYAVAHESLIRRVLETSGDAGQRAIAAQLMGYAAQSSAQIAALVRAGRDPEESVRNNAVRALWVIAQSNPKRAVRIPPENFMAMLGSPSWTDRNKAGVLLDALTRSRNPEVLREVCTAAREPLLEMARWRDSGHAAGARSILGRCAGIPEERLRPLAAGSPGPFLEALHAR